jgi:hypothetical protein
LTLIRGGKKLRNVDIMNDGSSDDKRPGKGQRKTKKVVRKVVKESSDFDDDDEVVEEEIEVPDDDGVDDDDGEGEEGEERLAEDYDTSGISEVSLCSKIGKTLLSLYSYKRAVKFFKESIEQSKDVFQGADVSNAEGGPVFLFIYSPNRY